MTHTEFTEQEKLLIKKIRSVSFTENDSISLHKKQHIFTTAQKSSKKTSAFKTVIRASAMILILGSITFLFKNQFMKPIDKSTENLVLKNSEYDWNYKPSYSTNRISYSERRLKKKHATFQSRQRKWRRKLIQKKHKQRG